MEHTTDASAQTPLPDTADVVVQTSRPDTADVLLQMPELLTIRREDEKNLQYLRESVESAMEGRPRRYSRVQSLSISYKDDDTGAATCAENFARTIEVTCGLQPPNKLLLEDDAFQDGRVGQEISVMLRKARGDPGRSLIIVHYAGHGGLNSNGQLYLAATQEPMFKVDFVDCFKYLVQWSEYTANVDVVIILDCCHAGTALTSEVLVQGDKIQTGSDRLVEVVAAVSQGQLANGNPALRRTFSTKFAEFVTAMKTEGRPGFYCADFVRSVQSQPISLRFNPKYKIMIGRFKIRIPILKERPAAKALDFSSIGERRRQASSNQSTEDDPPMLAPVDFKVSFTLTLKSGDELRPTIDELARSLKSLPPQIPFDVLHIWPSRSYVMQFNADWLIWAQLDGLPNFKLLFDVTGPDLLDTIVPQLPSQLSAMTLQENQRPRPTTKGKAPSSQQSAALQTKVLRENLPANRDSLPKQS